MRQRVTQRERDDLMELVDQYRDCLAKDLWKLGCTALMSVDIHALPGCHLVVLTVQDDVIQSEGDQ